MRTEKKRRGVFAVAGSEVPERPSGGVFRPVENRVGL